jgi:hypothetical protein
MHFASAEHAQWQRSPVMASITLSWESGTGEQVSIAVSVATSETELDEQWAARLHSSIRSIAVSKESLHKSISPAALVSAWMEGIGRSRWTTSKTDGKPLATLTLFLETEARVAGLEQASSTLSWLLTWGRQGVGDGARGAWE